MSAVAKWYNEAPPELATVELDGEQPSTFFLGYQKDWLADKSRLKVWEKSRRIGATFVQAYEDVRDAARAEGSMDVWFTSADETAAKEYIRYVAFWAKILNIAAQDLGEIVLDEEKDVKALAVQFSNGRRIHGLSSNPKAFRSKGGKLVVDEFAFHGDPDALWKAAAPVITWGYPVRILSTYNGKGNRYYRMVQDAKKGNAWSLHTTTIEDAVADGLVAKILGRPANDNDIETFLTECRDIAGDEETYMQEYMCEPVDEATAWLTYDLIHGCEHEDAGKPELYSGGEAYVGMDIARRRHLTIIWAIEKVGDIWWTREVVKMKNAKFKEQDAELDRMIAYYNSRRTCMDQTGIGEKPVEDAQERHGVLRVEGVLFTGTTKHHLATIVKQAFEDKQVRIPVDHAIREAHHAVRKQTTVAGNTRFDADSTDAGHADEFWAHGLALHAGETKAVAPAGSSKTDQSSKSAERERMRSRMMPRPGGRQSGIFRQRG